MKYGIIDKDTGKVKNTVIWGNLEWLPPKNSFIIRHDKIDHGDNYDLQNHEFTKMSCKTKYKIDVKSFHALVDTEGKIRNIIIRDDSDWTVPRNHQRVTVNSNTKIGDIPPRIENLTS